MEGLRDALDSAYEILRERLENSRRHGELCVRDMNLNGARDRLPGGIVESIEQVRRMYSAANDAAEKVLVEQFGQSSTKVEGIVNRAVREEAEPVEVVEAAGAGNGAVPPAGS